jgi:hypothetical protein
MRRKTITFWKEPVSKYSMFACENWLERKEFFDMTISSRKSTLILLPMFCVFVLAACSTRTPVQQVSIDDVSQNLKYKNILFGKFVESPNVQANVPTANPLQQCKSTAIS